MSEISLQADCSRCAGLCCVALAFDASEQFAIDKAADQPCRNLTSGGLCSVHAKLGDIGFGGCVLYTCDGAGQRVTQEVFAGKSWQDDAALLPRMTAASRIMRKIHQLLVLLDAATQLPLNDMDRKELWRIKATLDCENGWTEATLVSFEQGDVEKGAQKFLAGLRGYFPKERNNLA